MSRISGKPYFVCVLWTPSGHRFYTDISEDPQHRTDQHNQGISDWTAGGAYIALDGCVG
jgi:predicted GIY-YIG superfamily endonuclease